MRRRARAGSSCTSRATATSRRASSARAEAAGYEAVVVTLDTLILGWRPRDLGRAYLPFLRGIGLANYTSDPVFSGRLQGDSLETTVAAWIETFANPDLSWADIAWLREQTDCRCSSRASTRPRTRAARSTPASTA